MEQALHRRQIIVPLSKEAEFRLDYDVCMDGDWIEYSLNDNDFDKLCAMTFFEQMNDCLGLMIDDYEDEEILAPKLDSLNVFMHQFMHEHPNDPLLINLDTLFQVAYNKRTGVFFFF